MHQGQACAHCYDKSRVLSGNTDIYNTIYLTLCFCYQIVFRTGHLSLLFTTLA
jgi:hypothetical protein